MRDEGCKSAPHLRQKLTALSLSCPHFAQNIGLASEIQYALHLRQVSTERRATAALTSRKTAGQYSTGAVVTDNMVDSTSKSTPVTHRAITVRER
jgi:hypothetical protein